MFACGWLATICDLRLYFQAAGALSGQRMHWSRWFVQGERRVDLAACPSFNCFGRLMHFDFSRATMVYSTFLSLPNEWCICLLSWGRVCLHLSRHDADCHVGYGPHCVWAARGLWADQQRHLGNICNNQLLILVSDRLQCRLPHRQSKHLKNEGQSMCLLDNKLLTPEANLGAVELQPPLRRLTGSWASGSQQQHGRPCVVDFAGFWPCHLLSRSPD